MISGVFVWLLLIPLWAVADGPHHPGTGGWTPSDSNPTRPVPQGVWGGDQIRMVVTGQGASLEYSCAHGTIDQPLFLDEAGDFHAKGTHTRERGGPRREGEEADSHPAHYSGHVEGETMKLSVALTDEKEEVGTFALVHGREPRLVKCK